MVLFISGWGTARAASYPTQIGHPHPPLVGWGIEGNTAVSLDAYRGKKILVVYFASWSSESIEVLTHWQEVTHQAVAEKKLVLLGVMEEQHRDWCQLYGQWKKIDFPVIHDPLNQIGIRKVPTVVGIDEQGFLRLINPDSDRSVLIFIKKQYKYDKRERRSPSVDFPNPRFTKRMAGEAHDAPAWREHGKALILSGLPPQINEAISTYQMINDQPRLGGGKDFLSYFQLGVTYRIRYDSPQREAGDFQSAIDAWQNAARLNRKNGIVQNRIRQYGVRMEKPHSYYRWIKKARHQITARGESPIALSVEPITVELAKPRKKFKAAHDAPPDDTSGTASLDKRGMIGFESVVVRATQRKMKRYVQLLLIFRPRRDGGVQWDNRAESLRVWIEPPDGVRVSKRFIVCAAPKTAESDAERTVGVALRLPKKAAKHPLLIKCHALYRVAGTGDGTPNTLRRDYEVKILPKVSSGTSTD